MMSIKYKCGAAILALAATGVMADLIAPRPVHGAPPSTPQQVIVTNSSSQQVPVSISSLPSVSGSVSATQSGQWTVGISGTPSMNIGNLPSAPVPVRDVDVSNRVQLNAQAATVINQLALNISSFDPLPGGTLIDHVSFTCRINGGVLVSAVLSGTGALGFDYLPTPPAAAVLPGPGGSQINIYNVNTPASVTMYGGVPEVVVAASASASFDCGAYIAGHRLP